MKPIISDLFCSFVKKTLASSNRNADIRSNVNNDQNYIAVYE